METDWHQRSQPKAPSAGISRRIKEQNLEVEILLGGGGRISCAMQFYWRDHVFSMYKPVLSIQFFLAFVVTPSRLQERVQPRVPVETPGQRCRSPSPHLSHNTSTAIPQLPSSPPLAPLPHCQPGRCETCEGLALAVPSDSSLFLHHPHHDHPTPSCTTPPLAA